MTVDEVIDVLTVAAAFDRRTVGEADATAWHSALGDLPFADSRDAVIAHYRETREWIMPADIRERVKAVHAARLRATPVPDPPASLRGKPAEYQKFLVENRRRIAEGLPPVAAIEARS